MYEGSLRLGEVVRSRRSWCSRACLLRFVRCLLDGDRLLLPSHHAKGQMNMTRAAPAATSINAMMTQTPGRLERWFRSVRPGRM